MRNADCALHSRCALVNTGCKPISDFNEKEITRAKNTAYRLLTYRPRSRKELEEKLREREFGDAVIEAVVAGLIRLGYVNDREFACQLAASRGEASRLRQAQDRAGAQEQGH